MVEMTQISIPKKRRLEIKQAVINALVHSKRCHLPVEIKAIARSYKNIRLIPYSRHMKRMGISYEDMKIYAGTIDAFTDYFTNSNLFFIYYNDLDYNIYTSNRYRWNIAHELGHVLLNHHRHSNNTRIFRWNLSDSEYNLMENEADYFAQLILVPHVVLCGLGIRNSKDLKNICKISNPASRKRFHEYLIWQSHIDVKDNYDRLIFQYYYNFTYKRRCKTCGASLILRHGKYCPICGNKNTLKWGDGNMIYKGFETYTSGKLIQCPRCQNEQTNIQGEYCQICGSYLVNRCIGDCNYIGNCSYNMILPTNARYCPISGNKSIFYDQGFLQDWNQKLHSPNSNPESNEQLALEPPEDPFWEHPDFDQLAEELP